MINLNFPPNTVIDLTLSEDLYLDDLNDQTKHGILSLHYGGVLHRHGIELISYSRNDDIDLYYMPLLNGKHFITIECTVRTTIRDLLKSKLTGFIEYLDDFRMKIKTVDHAISVTSIHIKTTRLYANGEYTIE